MTEHPQFVYDGSVDPGCRENGCPDGCGHGPYAGGGVYWLACGGCCDCLGGCRIAYYRQQEEHERTPQ